MKIPAPHNRPDFHCEIVVATIATVAIVHYIYLFAASDSVFVQFVPDNAFYELQLARHFVSTGKWSFDRGISSTTGFHLLNVYLMSCFPRSLVQPWFALRVWSAVGLVLSLITALVICRFGAKIFGLSALVPTFWSQLQTSLPYHPFDGVVGPQPALDVVGDFASVASRVGVIDRANGSAVA